MARVVFKFDSLDTLELFPHGMLFQTPLCNFSAIVECPIGCVVCNTFLLEETKLAIFGAEPASGELTFSSWIGFAVI